MLFTSALDALESTEMLVRRRKSRDESNYRNMPLVCDLEIPDSGKPFDLGEEARQSRFYKFIRLLYNYQGESIKKSSLYKEGCKIGMLRSIFSPVDVQSNKNFLVPFWIPLKLQNETYAPPP